MRFFGSSNVPGHECPKDNFKEIYDNKRKNYFVNHFGSSLRKIESFDKTLGPPSSHKRQISFVRRISSKAVSNLLGKCGFFLDFPRFDSGETELLLFRSEDSLS